MKNEGSLDRLIRIVMGIGVLSLLFVLHGPVRWFGFIGLVPLLTGLTGACPMYSLLGIRTCSRCNTDK